MINPFPERGQIWLVNLDPTIGAEIKKIRPSVVISNNVNNQYASTVTVLPITDKGSNVYPFEVSLPASSHNLKKDSKIKCQQIRTVDKTRLIKSIGKVSNDKIQEIEQALLIHLDVEK